jgi:hypothetical protein
MPVELKAMLTDVIEASRQKRARNWWWKCVKQALM